MKKINLAEIILKNKKLLHDNKNSFFKIFSKDLKRFIDPLSGFDIVGFDEELCTPRGMSLSDHVKNIYGDQAHDLIKKLINMR